MERAAAHAAAVNLDAVMCSRLWDGYLDMTDRTVRDWLKEMSDEYQNDRGVVTHI